MKTANTIILIVMLALTSCAFAKNKKEKTPEWLTNPQSKYPTDLFLTAIGTSDSRQQAEDMAAGNISRIFESKVKAESSIQERYKEIISSDKDFASTETTSLQDVNIKSDQTLYNIQFGESYTDKYGSVHVIAFLDRMATADIYTDKIGKHSSKISSFLKNAQNATDMLEKYALLNAAYIFALNNDVLITQLGVISPHFSEFVDLPYDIKDIMLLKRKVAGRINFVIDIADSNGKLNNIVTEILTEEGFEVGKNGYFTVNGKVEFEEIDIPSKEYKFARYKLNMEVKDKDGAVIISLFEKGREGHISVIEAKQRAYREIEKKLHKKFKKKLHLYIDGFAK